MLQPFDCCFSGIRVWWMCGMTWAFWIGSKETCRIELSDDICWYWAHAVSDVSIRFNTYVSVSWASGATWPHSHIANVLVEFLIIADGQLNVPWNDALLLVLLPRQNTPSTSSGLTNAHSICRMEKQWKTIRGSATCLGRVSSKFQDLCANILDDTRQVNTPQAVGNPRNQ